MSAASPDGSGGAASLLLVVGSQRVQRHVWEREGCAYWTAAFEILLEKHGLLDFDRADESILADPQKLAAYDALIVGRLPAAFWQDAYVESLEGFRGPVFLEGPFEHPGLLQLLQIEAGSGPALPRSWLHFRDEDWKGLAAERFSATLRGRTDGVEIAAKTVLTKAIPPDAAAHRRAADPANPRDAAGHLALAGVLALRRRFERDGRFFPDPDLDAVAMQACAELIGRLEPSAFCQDHAGFLRCMTGNQPAPSAPAGPLAAAERLADRIRAGGKWLDAPDRDLLPGLLEGRNIEEILLLAAELDRRGHAVAAETLLGVCLSQAYDPAKGAFHNARAKAGRLQAAGGYSNSPWIVLALLRLAAPIAVEDGASAARAGYDAETVARWAASPLRIARYRTAGSARDLAVFEADGAELSGIVENGRFLAASFPILGWLTHHHTMHPLAQPFFDCPPDSVLAMETLFLDRLERHFVNAGADILKVHAWPWNVRYCLTLRCDVDRVPTADQHERLLAWQDAKGIRSSWYWIPGRLDGGLIAEEEALGHEIGLHAVALREKERERATVEAALSRQDGVSGETWHVGGSDYWVGWPSVDAARRAGFAYTEFVPTVFDLPYAGFPVVTDTGEVGIAAGCVGITQNASHEANPGQTRKADLISRSDVMREWSGGGFHICILHHPDGDLDTLAAWVARLPAEGRLAWRGVDVADWWHRTHRREALGVSRLREGDGPGWVLLAAADVNDLEVRLLCAPARALEAEVENGGEFETAALGDGAGRRVRLSLRAGVPCRLRLTR